MNVNIRQAAAEDASSIFKLASQLKLQPHMDKVQEQSGFLVDVSLNQYRYFIAHDDVLVMEIGEPVKIEGFSIVLGPKTVDAIGMRKKAKHIRWEESFVLKYSQKTSAYYEQIALNPRYAKSIYTSYLAFMSLWRTFQRWVSLFAAVVSRPVPNKAPLPFLDIVGWQKVGSIDEIHSGYGQISYDIYYLDRSVFESKLQEPNFSAFLKRLRTRPFFA
jgi:hypothetical protein